MKKTATGVRVHYCGHDASFIADVREHAGVVVVIGPENVEEHLQRPAGKCQFHLVDCPVTIYWGRKRGVFAVPTAQLRDLRKEAAPCA
jgi:hypothetical protein